MVPKFKIMIMGDREVGKSSYIHRLLTGEFLLKWKETIDVQKTPILFFTNYGPIIFEIWEPHSLFTSGIYTYNNCAGAHGALLLFDLGSRVTYRDIPDYYSTIEKQCGKIPTVLIGNKTDSEKRKVKVKMVDFHRKIGGTYIEVSVKNCINLEKPLLWLLSRIIGKNDIQFTEEPALLPPFSEETINTSELFIAASIPLPANEDENEIED